MNICEGLSHRLPIKHIVAQLIGAVVPRARPVAARHIYDLLLGHHGFVADVLLFYVC